MAIILGFDLRASLLQLAGTYGQVVAVLRECMQYVPKDEGLDPKDWTSEIRRAQADALRTLLAFEHEALETCEQILSSAKGDI